MPVYTWADKIWSNCSFFLTLVQLGGCSGWPVCAEESSGPDRRAVGACETGDIHFLLLQSPEFAPSLGALDHRREGELTISVMEYWPVLFARYQAA